MHAHFSIHIFWSAICYGPASCTTRFTTNYLCNSVVVQIVARATLFISVGRLSKRIVLMFRRWAGYGAQMIYYSNSGCVFILLPSTLLFFCLRHVALRSGFRAAFGTNFQRISNDSIVFVFWLPQALRFFKSLLRPFFRCTISSPSKFVQSSTSDPPHSLRSFNL